jgi:Mad3/BUB1 homology region 1
MATDTGTTTPLWEGLKENAAPLQRGRSVQALERSLAVGTSSSMMTEDFRLQIERQIEYFERKVQPSEAAAADSVVHANNASNLQIQGQQTMMDSECSCEENPLQYWIEYIKFHQDNFPSNTREQKLLLERCVRALSRFPKYSNNVTFVVSICCNYASNTDQPAEIFKFMFQSNIGTKVAKFYAAWAYVAEKQEDFEEAKKIFELGIRHKAEPIKYLLGRQSHFHRRMSRHWINSTAIVDDHDDDRMEDDSERGPRGAALGGLSEEAFRKNDRRAATRQYQRSRVHIQHPRQHHHQSSSSSTSQSTYVDRSATRREAPRSNVVNSGGAFAIFVDENSAAAPPLLGETSFVANPDRQLEREEDRRKENTRDVERWNARGGYAPMYNDAVPQPPARRARTTTPFAVHVDAELAAQHEEEAKQEEARLENMRRHRDERTFRQRDGHGSVEDKLARDPLRYVRNPNKLEEDKRRAEKEDNKRRGREKDARMAKLLKNKFGEEQCFHEARAIANYYKLAPAAWNINRFIAASQSSRDESDMSVDESADDDVSMADQQPPSPSAAKMNISFSHQKMPSQRPPPLSNRSFSSRNDSLHSYTDPTPRNTSTSSSTVDEATAVGAVCEPTINTQFALKELSMMFSSPAIGLNDSSLHQHQHERHGGLGPILNETGDSEAAAGGGGADAMASIDEAQEEDYDIMESNDLAVDSSLVVGGLLENQSSLPNPHARTTNSPNFDSMALRTLQEDQGGGSSSVGCSSSRGGSSRSAGDLSQDDPFRALGAVELNNEPGFQIYEDDERDHKDDNRYPLIAKREAAPPHPARAVASPSQPFAFEIFQDTRETIADGSVAGLHLASPSRQDSVEHAADDHDDEKQDANNKSVFDILDEELQVMSQIVEELDAEEKGGGENRGKTTLDVSKSLMRSQFIANILCCVV